MRTVVIDQKALMQPLFRGRRELEFHKKEYRINEDRLQIKFQDVELSIALQKEVPDEEVFSSFLPKVTAAHRYLHQYYSGDFWHHRTTWDMKKG